MGRPASRRAVPQPEHRGVVLSHARVEDRRAVDALRRARADGGAVADPDPVLYYEHIALYRDPRIRQALDGDGAGAAADRPRRAAARRRRSGDRSPTAPTCTSRCASPTRWPPTASRRACSTCARWRRSIATPCCACARHCNRVLIVHEDTRTGGIGESLAAIIQEEAFESLDAPVRIDRRARHAGAVLAAARGLLPAGRARNRARRATAGRLLKGFGGAGTSHVASSTSHEHVARGHVTRVHVARRTWHVARDLSPLMHHNRGEHRCERRVCRHHETRLPQTLNRHRAEAAGGDAQEEQRAIQRVTNGGSTRDRGTGHTRLPSGRPSWRLSPKGQKRPDQQRDEADNLIVVPGIRPAPSCSDRSNSGRDSRSIGRRSTCSA